MIGEAWAYLSRVAEPPAPGVVALVARLGPVEAAERIRSGRVDERVAAETAAGREVWRAEADLAAATAAGARLITPGHPGPLSCSTPAPRAATLPLRRRSRCGTRPGPARPGWPSAAPGRSRSS
jgi:hypothetical protein